ncbi:MarR family winged helix-turn-helix transcriptional regulator [Microbacterium sp. NPDC077663]|uniref:MarR family winged helix-turn-helix transcriptional regulator n=1 Tax=Microbacterium sp. NPDC077663 TaxID=3364189 RepID=UPI0037C9927D
MTDSTRSVGRGGYWYNDAPGQKERARRVLEALRTYRAAEAAMRRRTRDSMAMGENELLALRYLLRQPGHSARPYELARYLGITSASVTTMIDKLVNDGRVERVGVTGDRRGIMITATAHANEEVRDTLGKMHIRMYAVASKMSPTQQKHVVDFLEAMVDAVDHVEPA